MSGSRRQTELGLRWSLWRHCCPDTRPHTLFTLRRLVLCGITTQPSLYIKSSLSSPESREIEAQGGWTVPKENDAILSSALSWRRADSSSPPVSQYCTLASFKNSRCLGPGLVVFYQIGFCDLTGESSHRSVQYKQLVYRQIHTLRKMKTAIL